MDCLGGGAISRASEARSTRATSSASGTASSLNRGAASGVPTPGQQLLGPDQHHRHFDAQLGRLLGLIGPATKRTACQQPQTLVTRDDDCRLRGCPVATPSHEGTDGAVDRIAAKAKPG
jgi:hypothetical protein